METVSFNNSYSVGGEESAISRQVRTRRDYVVFQREEEQETTGWGWLSDTWVGLTLRLAVANDSVDSSRPTLCINRRLESRLETSLLIESESTTLDIA